MIFVISVKYGKSSNWYSGLKNNTVQKMVKAYNQTLFFTKNLKYGTDKFSNKKFSFINHSLQNQKITPFFTLV